MAALDRAPSRRSLRKGGTWDLLGISSRPVELARPRLDLELRAWMALTRPLKANREAAPERQRFINLRTNLGWRLRQGSNLRPAA